MASAPAVLRSRKPGPAASSRSPGEHLGDADGALGEVAHVSSVLVKPGARDRTQAVIAAYESGFLEPS